MIHRRDLLQLGMASVAAGVMSRWLHAAPSEPLIQRVIPASGERLPVVGLGSSASFEQSANRGELQGLAEVFKAMLAQGATVFDTAPSYGESERVAGRIARELNITDKVFWATKTEGSYRDNDPKSARAQVQESIRRLGAKRLDLVQVHNLGDLTSTLAVLKDLKHQGVIRYLGVTTTFRNQYADLLTCMRNERLDFIGVDYAIDDRAVEKELLPAAIERGIAVMVYEPFGRSNLFRRVAHAAVPDWAQKAGMKTWAQFFLKFVIAHPAITVVTPATTQPAHMSDNLAGGSGALPDAEMRKRMIEVIDALP